VVKTTHIILRLSKETGHQHQREGLNHTRQILAENMPIVARAMEAFFKGIERKGKIRMRRWAMTALEDDTKWTANTSTTWLQTALKQGQRAHNATGLQLGFQ